jgi:hypothetical protein
MCKTIQLNGISVFIIIALIPVSQVCNCGVSNHHLAMWGVVKVLKKKIPNCGDRSVGIIRRQDDDVVETEVNVQLFRERIVTLQKVQR